MLIAIIIVLTLVTGLNLSLALLVWLRNKKSPAHISFGLVTIGMSFWALTNALFQSTMDVQLGEIYALASYYSAVLMIVPFFYFSVYIGDSTRLRKYLHWFLIPIAIIWTIVISIPDFTLITVEYGETGGRLITGPGLPIYSAFLVLLLLGVLINFLRAMVSARGVKRTQIAYMLIGLFFAAVLGVIFNLLLPIAGNYQFVWLGPNMTLFFIGATAYSILKHRLFDIQIQFQKIVNVSTPVIISIAVTSLIGYMLHTNSSLNGFVIGLISLISVLVLYKLFEYVFSATPLSHVFFQRTYAYQKALRELANDAPKIIDVDHLATRIVTTLVDQLRAEKAAIIIRDDSTQETFELLSTSNFHEKELASFIHADEKTTDAFLHGGISFTIGEVEQAMQQEHPRAQMERLGAAMRLFQSSEAAVVIGLLFKQNVMGFIVLGEKFRQKPYTKEDIDLLEQISQELAIALVNSKLHQDREIRNRMLKEEVDRATEAWRKKSEENERLLQVKSQFITVTSHQLRTPVSVIRNTLQMLIDEYLITDGPESEYKQRLEDAANLVRNSYLAGENLRNTTEMIMAVSELEGGGSSVNVDRFDFYEFLNKRSLFAQDLLKSKSKEEVHFQPDIDEDIPKELMQDKQKLGMMLDNLLSNAVLYTVRGEVTLRVQKIGDMVEFEVQDTGIGIEEAQSHKLFERFVRLDNGKKVVADGNGLGLYLVKQYTDMLGGEVEFESSVGIGTTFTVRIPIEYQYS